MQILQDICIFLNSALFYFTCLTKVGYFVGWMRGNGITNLSPLSIHNKCVECSFSCLSSWAPYEQAKTVLYYSFLYYGQVFVCAKSLLGTNEYLLLLPVCLYVQYNKHCDRICIPKLTTFSHCAIFFLFLNLWKNFQSGG